MSNQSTSHVEKRSGNSIERKLLLVLLIIAIVPITILVATAATGMYQYAAIITTVVTQVAGLIVAYYFVSGIVRQSMTINETLIKLKNGDFEARANTNTTDELGEAAVALNEMCDNTLNLIQSRDEREQIQTSIENLISEMKEIAAGDLTISTEVHEDMTGSIAESVNHMTTQLRSIVQQVQLAAEQVTNSSARIQETSTTISNDSDAQASSIGEASKQLLEILDSFQNVAELTKESVQVAVEARQTASNGLKAVSDTVEGMQRIRNQVQSTSKRIKSFGESSQEIGEIVQLISDITDRTSILALNASIQAAMAGDAGQGFAIVAEEIERLAERSTDATKRISKLIRAIQHETSEVISDMEESTREVVAGSQLASQAGETLFEIDSVSNQLVELIQSSSTYALQHADTATKVASSMSEISLSTKASAEKRREAARSVGRLADTVSQLRDSVSQFKVADDADRVNCDDKMMDKLPSSEATAGLAQMAEAIHDDELCQSGEAANMLDNVEQASAPTTKTIIMDETKLAVSNAAVAVQAADANDDRLLRQLHEARVLLDNSKSAERDEDSNNQTLPEQEKTCSRQPTPTIMIDEEQPITSDAAEMPGLVTETHDADVLRQLREAQDEFNKTREAGQGVNKSEPQKSQSSVEQNSSTRKVSRTIAIKDI